MRKKESKENLSGIQLAAPRLTGNQPAAITGILFGFLMTLLAVGGAQWCFISVFSIQVLPLTILLYTVLFATVLSAVYRIRRVRPVVLLALTLLYAWVGYSLYESISQGFIIVTNQIMKTYAAHSNYVFPLYAVAAKQNEYPLLCTIFLLYACFFLCLFLSWAIVRRQSFGLTFAATIPFPAAGFIFYISPDFRALLMLTVCWFVLLFIRILGKSARLPIKRRDVYRAVVPDAAAKSGLQVLPAAVLCIALVLAVFPQQTYRYSDQAQQARTKLVNAANDYPLFETGDTMAGTSDHVNLRGADSIHFTGKTMLQVQATAAHSAYLKGFTGSIYTGRSWEKLPDSDYTEIDKSLGALNVQNFSSQMVTLGKEALSIDTGGYGIHVKNTAANKRIIYTPYNLTTTPTEITGVKFIHDMGIRSGSLFGTSEYTLYANSFNNSTITSNVPGLFGTLYSTQHLNDPVKQKKLARETSAYVYGYLSPDNSIDPQMFYTGATGQKIPEDFNAESKNFLSAEQAYRLFMYDKYTQLPPDIKQSVRNLMQKNRIFDFYQLAGYDSSDEPVKQMVESVKNYLAKNYRYTLSPGKVPDGKDFVEYFLTENPNGYCVHFATAAAVMLRAVGIPVRYAEGYLVTSDDITKAKGGWANIPDTRAHAWIEVYYPGLGWQPVEMTPGFNIEQNMTQDDIKTPEQTPSAPPISKPESSASSMEETESKIRSQSSSSRPDVSPAASGNDDVRAVMTPILAVVGAILLLAATASLRRKIATERRKRQFTQADRNKAALAVYAYMEKLLRFGGEIPQPVTDIALKARFSQHTVSQEELEFMRAQADLLARSSLLYKSKVEIIRIKYIYALA